VLASGAVLVTTTAPGSDPCAPITRTYVLDNLTGLAYKDGKPASGAITGQPAKARKAVLPVVLELSAFTGERGAAGGARATRKIGIVGLQGADSVPEVRQIEVSVPARRISWREVANWQELHDAAKK
jgi:type IV pilus assembly protein PilY1